MITFGRFQLLYFSMLIAQGMEARSSASILSMIPSDATMALLKYFRRDGEGKEGINTQRHPCMP